MGSQEASASVAGIYLLHTLIYPKWYGFPWLCGIVSDNCHTCASFEVHCARCLLHLGTGLDMLQSCLASMSQNMLQSIASIGHC